MDPAHTPSSQFLISTSNAGGSAAGPTVTLGYRYSGRHPQAQSQCQRTGHGGKSLRPDCQLHCTLKKAAWIVVLYYI